MTTGRPVKPLHWASRVFMGGLATLSALSVWTAFQYGVADLRQLAPRARLMQWQFTDARKVSWGDLSAVRHELAGVLATTPGDPFLHESLAGLYGRRAELLNALPKVSAEMLDAAIEHYRMAVVARPMSPYAWANLALAMSYRKGVTPEMWDAFERAARYGSRERLVQRIIAGIGFQYWDQASMRQRVLLVQVVRDALPANQADLMAIAKQYGHQDVLAP